MGEGGKGERGEGGMEGETKGRSEGGYYKSREGWGRREGGM